MTHSLAIRLNPANPDHHLWDNNGTWFVHYTIHPTPFTKQRIRASLGTKNLTEARARRDKLLFVATALSPASSSSCGDASAVEVAAFYK
jgi:hypothetical protein